MSPNSSGDLWDSRGTASAVELEERVGKGGRGRAMMGVTATGEGMGKKGCTRPRQGLWESHQNKGNHTPMSGETRVRRQDRTTRSYSVQPQHCPAVPHQEFFKIPLKALN